MAEIRKKRWFRFGLRTLMVVGLLVPRPFALGQPKPEVAEPEIDVLIAQLASDDFETRERATNELAAIGEAALPRLELAARESPQAEIRDRARAAIHEISRRQLQAAEMHVVGVSQAAHPLQLLEPHGAGVEWARLCDALMSAAKLETPTPAKRIWSLLPHNDQAIVSDPIKVSRLCAHVAYLGDLGRQGLKRDRLGASYYYKLFSALNGVLQRTDFYDRDSFSEVRLPPEAVDLLDRRESLSLLETWLLNRHLFESSFEGTVRKTDYSLENATITVEVGASRVPINLVLCSYHSVRWEVKAHEHARIKNIIMSGAYPQLVVGAESRVYSHGGARLPNAIHLNEREDARGIYAYEKSDPRYDSLREALGQITGMDIMTFQGAYSARQQHVFKVRTSN
jgi:hypothetical protein